MISCHTKQHATLTYWQSPALWCRIDIKEGGVHKIPGWEKITGDPLSNYQEWFVLVATDMGCRVDSRFVPSQWEMALPCNDVSHWLGANLEPSLVMYWCLRKCTQYWHFVCCIMVWKCCRIDHFISMNNLHILITLTLMLFLLKTNGKGALMSRNLEAARIMSSFLFNMKCYFIFQQFLQKNICWQFCARL